MAVTGGTSESGAFSAPTGTNCNAATSSNNVSKIDCEISGTTTSADIKLPMQPGDNIAIAASLDGTYTRVFIIIQREEAMKQKKQKITIIVAMFSLLCVLIVSGFGFIQEGYPNKLKLTVTSLKKIYKLGEVLSFRFSIENIGSEDVSFNDLFSTSSGYLSVHISSDGNKYVDSSDPTWGIVDFGDVKTTLKPNEKKTTDGDILWRWKSQGVPEFRFSKPGDYLVKVRYSTVIEEEKKKIYLESEPIKVRIEKPQGEDLKVWNKIKDNGHFAYFIKEKAILIPDYKSDEKAKFKQKLDLIIATYPNSFYAQSLRNSSQILQERERKRNEFYYNLNKPQ